MNQLIAALDAAWRVLAVGLLFGAGLPALFSIGVRQLAAAHHQRLNWRSVAHRALAVASFAVVAVAVLAGLGFIIAHGFGVKITFDGVVPTFSSK